MKRNATNCSGSAIRNATLENRNEKPKITFETRREALYFIREAVQLCHVDQKYTESEQREVYAIAEELGIEKAAVEPIEAWVEEGMAWNARGDALLEL